MIDYARLRLKDRIAPGYGITNIVARPTPGVMDLSRAELRAGRAALERKVRRVKPQIVALVGITVYRALFPPGVGRTFRSGAPVKPGRTRDRLGDAEVWVLPNPSGRNAHYSYQEMVRAFRALKRAAARRSCAVPDAACQGSSRAPAASCPRASRG